MNVMDLVVTLLVPVLLVSALLLATLVAVLQALERKKRLRESLTGNGRLDNPQLQTAEIKVAKFLTIVSLIILVLHSPSHVIRLKMLIASFVSADGPSHLDYTFQRVFEIAFYLNFSANLIIYTTAGDKFRSTLLEKLSLKGCRDAQSTETGEHKSITMDLNEATELTAVNPAFESVFFNEDDHDGSS